MTLDDILSKKVSYQEQAWSDISKEISILDILLDIKSDKFNNQISKLRSFINSNDLDSYNSQKKKLPAVTFCGLFNVKRKKEFLKEYNSIIVIDIDKLSDLELTKTKKLLSLDDYVFSYWESPSKQGLKGLVYLSYDFEFSFEEIDKIHKNAFLKLSDYFYKKYEIILDESGSDTTRLCFLSYDPHLITKDGIIEFNISNDNSALAVGEIKANYIRVQSSFVSSKDKLYNPKNRNQPNNRTIIQAIIKFLSKRGLSITSTYDDWYKVAYGIANTFTYDIGSKYYLALCKLDAAKFDEDNCINMLNYCYENSNGQITFNTIIYLANQKGYFSNSQRDGVSKTA